MQGAEARVRADIYADVSDTGMGAPSLLITNAFRRQRISGLCVVLLGCLFFAVRGYQNQTLALHSRDFKPVYAGARCLIDGCDPYDSTVLQRTFVQHGGDLTDWVPFVRFNATYPPSSLFLVTPLALLPFGLADKLWLGMGMVLFCGAAWCMSDLCSGRRALVVECILAAFVATSTMLIMVGQPAMMSVSLVIVAVWCFLKQRLIPLGVMAFAISLVIKPQIGAFIWLFFFLAARRKAAAEPAKQKTRIGSTWTYRRIALCTLAVTLILMTPGIMLAFYHPASADWPKELHANLNGIAAHGNFCDPGPSNPDAPSIANIQTVFSLVRDVPSFYNAGAIAVFLPLLLLWLYAVMRPIRDAHRLVPGGTGITVSGARDLLALAAAAALGFLPIYHRQYDTRLLLLIFPAVALLASRRRWMGWMAILVSLIATVTTCHQFGHAGPWLVAHRVRLPGLVWLVFSRPLPLTLLLVSCFFLYALFWVRAQDVEA